jgi:glycosyltransferase involved in cell wall biosynthesis
VTTEQQPDVSVVIPTRNRNERLRRSLEGLRGQTVPPERFEVIVVDDGSSDATPQVLEVERHRDGLDLRVLRRDAPAGPATAREEGWRSARSPLVAFTDDDCVPAPDWLERGLDAARRMPSTIFQGRTEPDPAERSRMGPFSRTIEVTGPDPGFQTCNIFYPREVLEAVDGFDAELFPAPGGEDADLAWRAIAAGFGTAYCADALVHHAVNELGPLGKLRLAYRWRWAMPAVVRHPAFRRAIFARGPFWKITHMWLACAIVAAALPRRWWPLRLLLAYPYLRSLVGRAVASGSGPAVAPFFVLEDGAEMAAGLHASIRFRTLIL